MSSDYRFCVPFLARLLGTGLMLLGLLVLAVVVAVLALPLPGATLAVVVPLGLAALGVGLLVVRRAVVVRLDEAGYRIRLVRGAGVRGAQWRQVEDVVATVVADTRCVVLRLRDGRTSTVPVGILDRSPEAFVQDLQQHLNHGHGYRPVPRAG
ncbi:MAG: hypothetical protein WB441_09855 [Nocardioidaceae bacterium]